LVLSQEQLNALARHGATARLNELRQEIAAIEQAFPDLRARRRGRRQTSAQHTASASDAPAEVASESDRKGRRGWSAAARKAAAARMKAYWAKRKARGKK